MSAEVLNASQLKSNAKIRPSQLGEQEKKAIIIRALEQNGYNPHEASVIMNADASYVQRIRKKEQTGILAPLAKLARRRVKDVLSGKAIENTEKARTSDVLNAATMVLDRVEPRINKSEIKSLSAHLEISTEERAEFLRMLDERKNAQNLGSVVVNQIDNVDNQDKTLINKDNTI